MKAEEIRVSRLYESGDQLLVPLWQRHYSWGPEHWRELWDDLQRVAAGDEVAHFVGSIVLKEIGGWALPSEAHRFWVVDGQQRITTLTLLMCAIRDKIALTQEDPEARAAARKQYTSQLLINDNLQEEHQARLVLQKRDQDTLEPLVNGTWSGEVVSQVEKAYDFFFKELRGYNAEALESLMSVALTRLTAVWITLEEHDNGHRVFQTLNSGGKKLEQLDLVRNYFFLLLGDSGNDFYESHWREMEALLKGKELEHYFVAWAVSQGHAGGQESLFRYFQSDLRDFEFSPSEIQSYGIRLVETSRLFSLMRAPHDSSYEPAVKRTLIDLANWGTIPADGLILYLLREEKSGRLNQLELHDGLEVVLSFMARRQLAGYEPNRHKSLFVKATRRLRQAQLSRGDLVLFLRYLLSEGAEASSWPSDQEVEADVRTVSAYSRSRQGWTFLILERIERGLYENSKHAQENLARGKYSVEHLLPQSLTEEWRTDLEKWGDPDPSELHETRLHSLGNLTLTPINSELGNRNFYFKRERLADDSLRINQQIVDEERWTRDEIENRSVLLARIACTQFVSPLRGAELHAARERFSSLQEPESESAIDDEQEFDDVDLEAEDELSTAGERVAAQ